MTDDTFQRVESTDRPLYGPRGVLICGYSKDEMTRVDKLIQAFPDLPVTIASENDLDLPLLDLVMGRAGADEADSTSPSGPKERTVVLSGLLEKELHWMMAAWKALKLESPLWATLTPHSESWSLRQLIRELTAEREAFARRARNGDDGKKQDTTSG